MKKAKKKKRLNIDFLELDQLQAFRELGLNPCPCGSSPPTRSVRRYSGPCVSDCASPPPAGPITAVLCTLFGPPPSDVVNPNDPMAVDPPANPNDPMGIDPSGIPSNNSTTNASTGGGGGK